MTTDQPDDPDWDWSQMYSAQVAQRSGVQFGSINHLKVRRYDNQDGIPWDVLQRIKHDVLGQDVLTVEFYPPQAEVVNGVNMRHLWAVLPAIVAWYRDISLSRQ